MKYLLTFESLSDGTPENIDELAEFIHHIISETPLPGQNRKPRLSIPITKEEYWKLHQRLDDYYGLESDDVDSSIGEWTFNPEQSEYESFREVASDYDKLEAIKAVADYLNKKTINFCDMGCGLGQMVYFCKKMNLNSIGVEYQTRLKPAHDELKIEVIYGDFFNMNLSFLMDQDIVYLYNPIDDIEMTDELLRLIYDNTNPDVIVIFSMLNRNVNIGYWNKSIFKGEDSDNFADCLLYKTLIY
jgi:hypothetical protein